MKVEMTVYGARRIEAELTAVGMRASEMEPLWESLHQDLMDIERDQFDSQGAQGASGPWAELMASTMAVKKYTHPDGQILRATDQLFESLTEDGAGHMWEADNTGWLFGTSVSYAHFHKTGGFNMVPRPPISLTRIQRDAILVKIRTYIVNGVVPGLLI